MERQMKQAEEDAWRVARAEVAAVEERLTEAQQTHSSEKAEAEAATQAPLKYAYGS